MVQLVLVAQLPVPLIGHIMALWHHKNSFFYKNGIKYVSLYFYVKIVIVICTHTNAISSVDPKNIFMSKCVDHANLQDSPQQLPIH